MSSRVGRSLSAKFRCCCSTWRFFAKKLERDAWTADNGGISVEVACGGDGGGCDRCRRFCGGGGGGGGEFMCQEGAVNKGSRTHSAGSLYLSAVEDSRGRQQGDITWQVGTILSQGDPSSCASGEGGRKRNDRSGPAWTRLTSR